MKKLIVFILFILLVVACSGQNNYKYVVNAKGGLNVSLKALSADRVDSIKIVTGVLHFYHNSTEITAGGSMVYPASGISLSSGSGWNSSITNNSGNWNTAYGWGNHATAGYAASSHTQAETTVTFTNITTNNATTNNHGYLPRLGGGTTNYLRADGIWATPSGGSGMVYPGDGIPLVAGGIWGTSVSNNSTNWNTAYTDKDKWNGGATGLTASTGRTSLGATTIGTSFFTLSNPGAITFPKINADNSVTARSATNFKTDLSINNVENTALSTWNGTSNISTVGTVASGIWNGTAIIDTYLSSTKLNAVSADSKRIGLPSVTADSAELNILHGVELNLKYIGDIALMQSQVDANLTDNTPTAAEITSALGVTPSAAGKGYARFIKDTNGSGLIYLCTSDGSVWQYIKLTIAV